MSQPIRALTPKICPACGAAGRFIQRNGLMTCEQCGHAVPSSSSSPFTDSMSDMDDDPNTPSAAKQTADIKRIKPKFKDATSDTADIKRIKPRLKPLTSEMPAVQPAASTASGYSAARLEQLKKLPISEAIVYGDEISSWVRAIYSTGLQHLRKQEWAEAIKAFKRAIDEERDFVDAHLWLARLSLTEKDQREHLSAVLAMMPNHVEAMSMMMVLNGQMTEAEAQRATNPHMAPTTQEADGPVAAQAKHMKCPNCGGRMNAGEDGQSVVCEFCGHSEVRAQEADYGFKSLSMALLKQRGQTVQWVVGERLLKCQTCGAERTLQHGSFSERCLFCGSSYVVETDALGSFQQPDGMLRFSIKKQQAKDVLQKALSSSMERVKSWFVNNEAERISLETLYVPFWLFDVTLDVRRTFTRKSSYSQDRSHHVMPPVHSETFSEMAHDVPIVGSKEVDRKLITRSGQFAIDRVQPYHPDLLASHSALIYSLPFDKAALDARQIVSERMRTLYEQNTSEEEVRVALLIQNIMFRLVLMPFWVVSIVEEDGDLRPGLINGQTGEVALGKARKPKG